MVAVGTGVAVGSGVNVPVGAGVKVGGRGVSVGGMVGTSVVAGTLVGRGRIPQAMSARAINAAAVGSVGFMVLILLSRTCGEITLCRPTSSTKDTPS
jgi:hypothetical protein